MGVGVRVQDRRILPTLPTADMLTAPVPRAHYFARDSYWNTPVASYAPYQHPSIPQANSANWVRSLCQQMLLDPATGAWTGGTSYAYLTMWAAIPVYVVPAGQPRRPFTVAPYNLTTVGGGELDIMLRQGVPAPSDLATGAGADNSAIIYQPSTDTMWELFSLQKSSAANSFYDVAGWGGVIISVSKFDGTYADIFRSDGVQVQHHQWGASATSISLAGGLLDVDEVAAGSINHALPMTVGHAQGSPLQWVSPATRGDGVEFDRPDYIPEGARVVFPPSADFSRVRPEFMPVARAIQRFGVIPMDKTGGGVALKLREGPAWEDVLTLYQTDPLAGWRYMTSLPWHQAVVVAPV